MTSIYIKEGTVLPVRRDLDAYYTPINKVLDGLGVVLDDLSRSDDVFDADLRILDPGAGSGRWGADCRNLWPQAWIAGVEVREVRPADAYDQWVTGAFNELTIADPEPGTWDLVIGNPPYALASQFIEASLHYLRPGGRLLFLLRLAFLEGKGRGGGLFREHPVKRVEVCVNRPSFTDNGRTNATAYAFFLWERGWRGGTTLEWR